MKEGWLMDNDGKKLGKDISAMINALGKVALGAMAVYVCAVLWVAFKPQIQTALRFMQGALFG